MNNINFIKNENIEGLNLLNQSIASFNGAAQKFETHYRNLEERVRELDLELEFKNRQLKKNLNEKEEVKNYLRNILESLTTGVIVLDLEEKISTFNRAAEYMTGLRSKDVMGKRIDKIMSTDLFPNLDLQPELLMDVYSKNEVETIILQKGKDDIYVSLSSFPVTDPLGNKIGTALNLQDITQLKKLEEKANRSDRLAAMGEMAAEIAHEIRNPLGSIELFATTLKKDLEDFGELRILAEHISSGVRSMNNVISNLLLFIRPDHRLEFQIFDILTPLNDSLSFSCDLVESNGRNIDVVTQYPFEPLLIHGDADLLKQVWLNLIMNAVQAMPDGGTLTISAKKVDCESTGSSLAEIRFSDTGNGISEDSISKIFNPFFTTKTKGTGLGLAIVHNILKIHGGDIDVESSEKSGTECIVTLPLWRGKPDD